MDPRLFLEAVVPAAFLPEGLRVDVLRSIMNFLPRLGVPSAGVVATDSGLAASGIDVPQPDRPSGRGEAFHVAKTRQSL
jgi:hypothetical protein